MLHKEILNTNQIELLPLIQEFNNNYYLCGGTAIALHIGHRRSIDFDLFSKSQINHKKILDLFTLNNLKPIITRRVEEQLHLIANNVKITFYNYTFDINADVNFDNIIQIPNLLQLAAMKAYALGRRAKWKDYVDLYFILKKHHNISEIISTSKNIYGDLFSEKQFRAQLAYFEDIDYTEEVDYLIEAPDNMEIQENLKNIAIDI